MENGETHEEIREIAVPQRDDDPREFHALREFHEALHGVWMLCVCPSRGEPDDFEGKPKENGHGATSVMGKANFHRIDLAETERNRGEGRFGVSEFEEMLDVSLREIDVELAELGIGSVAGPKPIAIVFVAKMRLNREEYCFDIRCFGSTSSNCVPDVRDTKNSPAGRWAGRKEARETATPLLWRRDNDTDYFKLQKSGVLQTARHSAAQRGSERIAVLAAHFLAGVHRFDHVEIARGRSRDLRVA